MARFFAWLERAVGEGEQMDEIAAADEAEKQVYEALSYWCMRP